MKDTATRQNRFKSLLILLAKCAFAGGIITAAIFLFPAYRCPDNAMSPSVRQGDLCVSCAFSEPAHNDVVLYRQNNATYMGRVIATGGQIVERGEGFVLIDGTAIPCPNAHSSAQAETVRQGSLFIVSDSSSDHDSLTFGSIPHEDVAGTVFWLFRCRSL